MAMNEVRWILLSGILLMGSCAAWPLTRDSLDGSLWCFSVAGFAAGILFRGMVDGRYRAREEADASVDASVKDLVKVHRPGGGADVDK
jgi:hypothetical protein